MIKREVLYDNEWLSLCKMSCDQEPRIKGYIYSHEKRCDGRIVACVPYRFVDEELEILLRFEATPCWRGKTPVGSSFTGGIDYNMRHMDPVFTMQKELREETGCAVKIEDIVPLGTCFGAKSADTVYYLYTCNLEDYDFGKMEAESELEQTSYCKWVNSFSLMIQDEEGTGMPPIFQFLEDPILAQCVIRLSLMLEAGLIE